MAKKYLSKEINFNVAPVMWQGQYVFPGPNGLTSNLFTSLIAVKHPLEVIIPDFYCQGNSYIGGKGDIGESLVVGQISAEVAVEAAPDPPYGGDGTIVILATIPRIDLEEGDIWATGNITAEKNIEAWENITAGGEVVSNGGGHVLSAKKNFDIPHPTKKGWRSTYSCLEGPEAAVYIRGKLTNTNIIKLPEYWKNLVDPDTITVSITPIGSHQDIFVKYFDINEIILQSKENTSINCFYHIFGEIIDTEK
ncbi:MAG: hypothetical protein ACO3UU_01825, partial [Minisyncoccia bacterium]